MKTLYIECNMGAAGDMLMAALLELLPEREAFIEKMNKLGIPNVRVTAEDSFKCGIKGTHVRVKVGDVEEASCDVDHKHHDDEPAHHHDHHHEGEHHHDHHHHDDDYEPTHEPAHDHTHSHTGLSDIEKTVSLLPVSQKVRNDILDVYKLIAQAESRAHGIPVSQIHFHEVGQADALVDITGVCLLMEEIAAQRVLASPIHVGGGFVRCAHGILPVPAPATAHILEGVPSYGGDIQAELCTPTGAALIKYFAESFCPLPMMTIAKTGYGMGKKDFERANCVRVFLGESESRAQEGVPNGQVAELSCNIDDMTGEALGFACRALMEEGALDVFTSAVGMKKNRPGVLLTCVCASEKADFFSRLMLRHTTTFGVRKAVLERYTLEREVQKIETPFGTVRIKKGAGYGVTKSKPEYDDVAALAKARNVSISEMEKNILSFLNNGEVQREHND